MKVDYNQISDYHRVANVIFRNTKTGETEVLSYGTLVTNPECKVPEVLAPFTDSTGFVTVDKYSLQHT